MAAAVVCVVVQDLLRKLSQGMDLGPRWRVEGHLREIHSLFSSVEGALPHAESKFGYSLELQEWVRKLKDVAYDTEDLLEELSIEEPLRLRDGKLRSLVRPMEHLLFGCRMWWKLRDVTIRLRGLVGPDRVAFIDSIQAEVRDAEHEARPIPFVGTVGEKEELIRLLLEEGRPFVTVGGRAGSGKTALVREVMEEAEVSGYFHVRIWANASSPMNENTLALEIIESIKGCASEEEEEEGEHDLLYLLANLLDVRKRYLFVLDDLSPDDREAGRWVRFRSLLVGGGAPGSKILATCHSFEDDGCDVYLSGMEMEDGLELLRRTAFQEDAIDIGPEKRRMMEDAVRGWLRTPENIKALGGYLSLQHAAADCPEPLFLFLGGYPYGKLGSPVVKAYNDLRPVVKRCFGICSLFPRGHAINRHTLSELWIALGYIKPDDDHHPPPLDLEDISDHYLDLLLEKELFQVKKSGIFGNVKSVELHPDVHDLAASVAGWECLALWWTYLWRRESGQDPRHISTIRSWEILWLPIHYSVLRTVLHFEQDSRELAALFDSIIQKAKRLRVLDLHSMKVDVVKEGVWKQKHLTYLDLSGNTKLQKLPPAIIRLINLQTLKLSGCSSLKELPRGLAEMVALRHLYIDGCWKLQSMPMGLGDLKSLCVLTDFILPLDDSSGTADFANLADLCKLNGLRGSLRITNLGYFEDELPDDELEGMMEQKRSSESLEGLMDQKSLLEFLELRFMNLPADTDLLEKLQPHTNLKGLRIHNYGGTQYPEWMTGLSTHLPNLVEIALIGCENCDYLPMFGHLNNLKVLSIQGLPDLEHMESGSEESLPGVADNVQPFRALSLLCIRDCPKLNSLPMTPHLTKLTLVNVSEEIFGHPCDLPNLKTLRIENIKFLDQLPENWLRNLTSLEELHIGCCQSLASLTLGMNHLKKLESLSIWNCNELDLARDEKGNVLTELEGLESLKILKIYKVSKLEHLPQWLSRAYDLRFLCIRSCPRLAALPEWIGKIWMLKLLELIHCPRLASLPDSIRHFSREYPKKLTIIGCPIVESRLREEEAEDEGSERFWPFHPPEKHPCRASYRL